jgi:hypothetical protein
MCVSEREREKREFYKEEARSSLRRVAKLR